MYMKLKDGKSKVLTLSYDDGVVQDIRLIDIMNKHGLKGTFNINTGRYMREDENREKFYGRLKLSESKQLYTKSGNEVAVHTLTHSFLHKLKPESIVFEIIEDRKNIENEYNQIARGMAYPYGRYNDKVLEVLKTLGICYSRTATSTEAFDFPENWLVLNPTCHHSSPRLMELAKKFVDKKPEPNYMMHNCMFYLWGHSYEFDENDNWDVIEKFAEFVGGRDDIWYATNIEIYDYVKAYESLQVSIDQKIIHNPTALSVWVEHFGDIIEIRSGQTLYI